jgi:preprotein translocase subunit SecG
MTARGSANLLTRTTAILATLFFATAIALTVLSEFDRTTSGILERAAAGQDGAAPASVLDALNALQGGAPASDLPVPASDPVAPAGADPVTEDMLPLPIDAVPAPEASAPEASGDLPVPEAPASN